MKKTILLLLLPTICYSQTKIDLVTQTKIFGGVGPVAVSGVGTVTTLVTPASGLRVLRSNAANTALEFVAPSSLGLGTVTSIATTAPITGGTITATGTIGISQSTTSTDGYLSSTDWNTFNGKYSGLPTQTGNAGKYLTTNGTTESWGTISATVPGGSDTQLQYNNSSSFGGISGATSNGTNVTFGSGNLLATSPRITTGIDDVNGNKMLEYTATGSAVDYFLFTNAATANPSTVSIKSNGSSSNINIQLSPKGTGKVLLTDGADQTKKLSLDLSGATTSTTLTIANSNTASRTLTIPVLAGNRTMAVLEQAQTFTANQTFSGDIIRSGFTAGGNNISTSAQIVAGVANTNLQTYKTTNAGSTLIGAGFFTSSLTISGTIGTALDKGNGNGVVLFAPNASNIMISRASMTITNLTNTAGSEAGDLIFTTQTGGTAMSQKMRISGTGNVIAGSESALATNATDGYLYIPTCAGTPTGTPTAYTGKAAVIIDTTNNKMYIYSGGAWVALN